MSKPRGPMKPVSDAKITSAPEYEARYLLTGKHRLWRKAPNGRVVHPAPRPGMPETVSVSMSPKEASSLRADDGVLDLVQIPGPGSWLAEKEPGLSASDDADGWLEAMPSVQNPGHLGLVEDIPRAYTTQNGTTIRTQRYWKNGDSLDQADDCSLGFALVHHLNALPKRNDYGARLALQIQAMASLLDVDETSPSIATGMRSLNALGLAENWRYAMSLEDMQRWLLYRGGLTLGVRMYEGMLAPDEQGYVRPTGEPLGRMALFVRGINPWGSLRLQYSLGTSWGHRGHSWLSKGDLDWIVSNDEEFRAVCWREARP